MQWVLSDRVFFEYSVIGFSSGSTVINSFLGSSVLFFRNVAIFLSNRATAFFIKSRCFVLHYILKKKLALNSYNLFNIVFITSTKLIVKKMKKYMIHKVLYRKCM